jgi:hypothetical protein
LVEKAESDDQLIEALRNEIQKLRMQITTDVERRRKQELSESMNNGESRIVKVGNRQQNSNIDMNEYNRMQRLCKQQVFSCRLIYANKSFY